MTQIGQTLRQARRSRGLELDTIARATRIPPKYLAALEDERFERLPGEAYTRSFLRQYARHLGLDPEGLLEELRARIGDDEEEEPLLLYQPRRRRIEPRAALAVVVAAGLAVAVALAAWQSDGSEPVKLSPARPAAKPAAAGLRLAARGWPGPGPRREHAPAEPRWVRLLAARGDCWLSVRRGSETGEVLYEGLLRRGASLRFRLRSLWIRMGAPWNLDVRIGGRRLAGLPDRTGNVLLTSSGLRPA